ncbi:MAG: leucyl/phenylalanyl-tRNA--protein transferase [Calditrichaeota bacterium]|nr:MAG: leucyl/phenylalanyl-tRNA--protein transferase [Calditrichota bacterium]
MKNKIDLSVHNLISAYSQGIFPMGNEFGEVNWYEADPRGIMPLESLHIPHDLKRILRQEKFSVTLNRAFKETITACADRPEPTWITDYIIEAYIELHKIGYAHSVETWHAGKLVGGLYGVSIGGAFFGESMFFRTRDASKVALVHLWVWLKRCGFSIFDIQMLTELLKRFGAKQIGKADYLIKLKPALTKKRMLKNSAINWTQEFRNLKEDRFV